MTVVVSRLVAFAALVVALVPSSALAVSDGAAMQYKQAHRRALDHYARGALGADLQRRDGATSPSRASELERRGLKAKRCAPKASSSAKPKPTSSPAAAPEKPKPTTSAHKSTAAPPKQTYKPAPPPASAPAGNPSGKKGIAWSADGKYLKNFVNGSTKIIYTWGATCPSQADSLGLQCASMLWSPDKNLEQWQSTASSHKYLMGFNEFNLGSQANMNVGQAVSAWNQYIRKYKDQGHYLVSPSVASSDSALPDLQQFLKTCGPNSQGQEDNCGISALSLHFYGTTSSDLINYVTKMHNGLNNLDVWLTEFACEDFSGSGKQCSQSMANQFLQEVVEWAEKTSWVVMYSPYGFASDISGGAGGVNNVNALMNDGGDPTALGKWYVDYNN